MYMAWAWPKYLFNDVEIVAIVTPVGSCFQREIYLEWRGTRWSALLRAQTRGGGGSRWGIGVRTRNINFV